MNAGDAGGKGQLQVMEPIIIVVFLALILGILLMFYLRIADTEHAQDVRVHENAQDLAVLQRMARLPEIACPKSETGQTYCIDLYKARAFTRSMENPRARASYFPVFGAARITVHIIEVSGETSNFTIYNTLNATANVRPSITYTTVYDPVHDTRQFAMVMIERQT